MDGCRLRKLLRQLPTGDGDGYLVLTSRIRRFSDRWIGQRPLGHDGMTPSMPISVLFLGV